MAILGSEEKETASYLELKGGSTKELPAGNEKQIWQHVELALKSGQRTASTLSGEDSLLCRTPTDELQMLIDFLAELTAGKRDTVFFEPSEPSFEMSFTRMHKGGIKVEAWLDAGNGSTGFYTWDAFGIRFYTNDELLVSFIEEARKEFFPLG
jgi:hypothetical protein